MALNNLSRWVIHAVVGAGLLVACASVLAVVGASEGLRDFAVVVGVFLGLPLWVVFGARGMTSLLARLAVAAGIWAGLWAIPLLWVRPWHAVQWGLGSRYTWWLDVMPDLLPFFLIPLSTLAIAAAVEGLIARKARQPAR